MTPEKAEDFLAWLDKRLAENCLTDLQLANKAGISHSVISSARKGKLPKWESLISIAQVFKADEVFVLRLAGLLPVPRDFDPELEMMKSACELVPKDQRALAYRMLKSFSSQTKP